MAVSHRYPIGMQDFAKIREGGYLYVDKTRYIWDMTHGAGEYCFLSRPRRFGKTLLVSTMQAYFEGKRELFEGLAIGELEQDWTVYPVVRFDLSTVKSTTMEQLEEDLDNVLAGLEERFGRDSDEKGWTARVEGIIRRAAATGGEGRAVVLIDEYDAPLLNVVHDPERLQVFRETMRRFYAPLKALDPRIRFLFMTGITKFSQLSIFSELNNIDFIGMLDRYAGICGITEEELSGALAPDVAWLAERMGTSPEETAVQLKAMYDGYHFSEGSPDIYNPFSLLTAMKNGKLGSYWFSSGTPTVLVNMMLASRTGLVDLQAVTALASDFDAPTESAATLIPLMYQSGYLTIKGHDPVLDAYTLGIPNGEVEEGLSRTLLPHYVHATELESNSLVIGLARTLYYDRDLDAALRLLRDFLSDRPYDLRIRDEREFQNVLYTMLRMVGFRVTCEVHVLAGSVDAVIEVPGAVFVLELKYSRATRPQVAADALAQIEERGYLVPFLSRVHAGELVMQAAGVVFSEDERTITGWEIKSFE